MDWNLYSLGEGKMSVDVAYVCLFRVLFVKWFMICRSYQRRLLTGAHASEEERVYATERAEELQSSLDTQFPSLVKPMKSSHVSGGFWLVNFNLTILAFDILYIHF